MDQVSGISAFVQVVNAGSFTGAAKRLEISPTSVTSRVQSFEEQLGVRLLNRTTRKVSLTEEGEAFYERCSRILAELAEVESLASALQSKPNGTLRVNTDSRLAQVVAPLLGEYAALFPDISCELIVTETLGDMVEEKFDLAVFAGPLPDSSLISRRLGVARYVLCGARPVSRKTSPAIIVSISSAARPSVSGALSARIVSIPSPSPESCAAIASKGCGPDRSRGKAFASCRWPASRPSSSAERSSSCCPAMISPLAAFRLSIRPVATSRPVSAPFSIS